jgi:hypothetical protein
VQWSGGRGAAGGGVRFSEAWVWGATVRGWNGILRREGFEAHVPSSVPSTA